LGAFIEVLYYVIQV